MSKTYLATENGQNLFLFLSDQSNNNIKNKNLKSKVKLKKNQIAYDVNESMDCARILKDLFTKYIYLSCMVTSAFGFEVKQFRSVS